MLARLLVSAALATSVGAACGSAESEPMPSSPPAATTGESTTTESTAPLPPPPKKAEVPLGIPRFAAGYRSWVKLNRNPIPPRASDPHNGTKNVFASRSPGSGGVFANGAVIVKEAVRPGADFVGLIAIMRKRAGADPEHHDWVFVEYTRESAGSAFTEAASGTVCWSCHVGAEATDYVFTLAR
jgi:hypothetical protein